MVSKEELFKLNAEKILKMGLVGGNSWVFSNTTLEK